MMSLDRPNLDWVALARGHGVEAGRANDLEQLAREFKHAMAVRGTISSSWSWRESKSPVLRPTQSVILVQGSRGSWAYHGEGAKREKSPGFLLTRAHFVRRWEAKGKA